MPIYAKLALIVLTKTAEFSTLYLFNLAMFQFTVVWGMGAPFFLRKASFLMPPVAGAMESLKKNRG